MTIGQENNICQNCNNPYTQEQKFCSSCGKAIITPDENIQNNKMQECPFCAELINQEAIKCLHCSSALTQAKHSPVRPNSPRQTVSSAPEPYEAKVPIMSNKKALRDAVARGYCLLAVGLLPQELQIAYQTELDRRKKNAGIAYMFLFLAGWLGAHRFYLNDRAGGTVYLIFTILNMIFIGLAWIITLSLSATGNFQQIAGSSALLFVLAGLFGLVVAIKLCFDFFRLPGQVSMANDYIRKAILFETESLCN